MVTWEQTRIVQHNVQRLSLEFICVPSKYKLGAAKTQDHIMELYRNSHPDVFLAPMPKSNFSKNSKTTLLKSHFGMGVLL